MSTPHPRRRHVALLIAAAVLFSAAGCARDQDDESRFSGTIEAVEVDIVPEVSGLILSRPVGQGDSIAIGDRVALIDSAPWQIALDEAVATLGAAQARLALLRSGSRREEIDAAAREREEARASLAQAEARIRRVEALAAASVAAADDVDMARRDRDVAAARVAATDARHALVARGFRREEVDEAAANVARLEAVRDRVALDLARTEVKSPVAGTVTETLQEKGEYARPGGPIVTVSDLANLHTWVYLGEADLGRVLIGEKVAVRIDSFPGRDFPGEVVYISKVAEFTPRNVQTREDRQQLVFGVKVAVANPGRELKVGLPADVIIPLASASAK